MTHKLNPSAKAVLSLAFEDSIVSSRTPNKFPVTVSDVIEMHKNRCDSLVDILANARHRLEEVGQYSQKVWKKSLIDTNKDALKSLTTELNALQKEEKVYSEARRIARRCLTKKLTSEQKAAYSLALKSLERNLTYIEESIDEVKTNIEKCEDDLISLSKAGYKHSEMQRNGILKTTRDFIAATDKKLKRQSRKLAVISTCRSLEQAWRNR